MLIISLYRRASFHHSSSTRFHYKLLIDSN
nr:MAG TPA: hypothetical protein [Caudoviricetes sp.]